MLKYKIIGGGFVALVLIIGVSNIFYYAIEEHNPLAMALLFVIFAALSFAAGVACALWAQTVNNKIQMRSFYANSFENAQLISQMQNQQARTLATMSKQLPTTVASSGFASESMPDLLVFDDAAFDN